MNEKSPSEIAKFCSKCSSLLCCGNRTLAQVEKIILNLKVYEVWSRRKNVPITSLTNATIDTKTKCISVEELLDKLEEIKNLKVKHD